MGINKSDVRWVVHWDLPKTLANLLQEMGRGGRDGQPAASRVYHTRRRRVTVGGGAGRGEGKALPVDSSIQRYCAAGARCRRALLLAHFGEAPAEDGPPRPGCCDRCDARLAEPAAAEPAAVAAAEPAVGRRPPPAALARGGSRGLGPLHPQALNAAAAPAPTAAAFAALVGGLASEDEEQRKRKLRRGEKRGGAGAGARGRSETALREAARRGRRAAAGVSTVR